MATQVDIVRGAFSEMTGAGARDNFTIEGNRQVDPILNVWDIVVRDALTIESWPWTVRRDPIARMPCTDGDYPYCYPLDALPFQPIGAGPLGVFDSADARQPVRDWSLRSNRVLYNGDVQVWVLYQYNAPPEAWTDQFAEYVRLRLCEATAFTYSGSLQLRQDFQRRAEEKKGEVVDSVGQATPPKALFRQFNTTAARLGGGYPIRGTIFPDNPGRP